MSNLLKNSIIDIINKFNEFFLNKKNVNGIGLGNKIIKGTDTNEPCLTVFVENKRLENNISKYDIIPKKFLGVKTDIIKSNTPTFSIAPLTIPTGNPEKDKEITQLQSFVRPIQAGYSIGDVIRDYQGTLGAIVFDNDTNEPYILSNNHVLSKVNENQFGHQITQGSKIVGYLYKEVILNRRELNNNNIMDCAIAKIKSDIPYTTDIYKIGKIKGFDEAEINMKVRKVGSRTGYTTGIITNTNVITSVNFSTFGIIYFKDIIVCTLMGDRGDSGSVVVDSNNNAIGLLFAVDDTKTLLNPIYPIISVLNIHF